MGGRSALPAETLHGSTSLDKGFRPLLELIHLIHRLRNIPPPSVFDLSVSLSLDCRNEELLPTWKVPAFPTSNPYGNESHI